MYLIQTKQIHKIKNNKKNSYNDKDNKRNKIYWLTASTVMLSTINDYETSGMHCEQWC